MSTFLRHFFGNNLSRKLSDVFQVRLHGGQFRRRAYREDKEVNTMINAIKLINWEEASRLEATRSKGHRY